MTFLVFSSLDQRDCITPDNKPSFKELIAHMLGCTELTQLSETAPSADRSSTHLKKIRNGKKKLILISSTLHICSQ